MKQRILLKSIFILILFISGVTCIALADEADLMSSSEPNSVPVTGNQERIFSRLEVPKTRVYLGQQLPVTISLYITELNVGKVFTPMLLQPEFDFGTVLHLASSAIVINGRQYQVIRFGTTMIPLKEGDVTLGPVSVNCKLSRNQEEDFESTPELDRLARGTLETTAPKIKLHVLSLPAADKPASFSGGVGQFRLVPELLSTNPKEGEPLTVRLTVSGSGNLGNISLPVLTDETGFDVFPIQRKTQTDHKVVFEQNLVPLDHRLAQIGPYQLTYFDPDAYRYRTATASLPIRIAVKPGFDQPAGALECNIAAIKESAVGLEKGHELLMTQNWFWWLQMLPILILMAIIGYRCYRQKLQTDIKLQLIRGKKLAEERLAAAKALIGQSETDRLLNELYSILQDYVNMKFNYDKNKTLMLKELSAGLEDEVGKEMQSFLTQYEQIRFTSTELKPSQAEDLWKTVQEIILRLSQMPAFPPDQTDGKTLKQQVEGRQYHG